MHKSRLGTIVIDCQTEQLDEAARFWGPRSAVQCVDWTIRQTQTTAI